MLCPPMIGQKFSRRFTTSKVASDQQFMILHSHFLTKRMCPCVTLLSTQEYRKFSSHVVHINSAAHNRL